MCVYWKVEQMEHVEWRLFGFLETAGIFSNFQDFSPLNLLDI